MYTSSLSWPNLFDVARNQVATLDDDVAVINRCKLLILTEPGELFNNVKIGVGLKQYLWQYNTQNPREIVKNKIISQLREYEPMIDADATTIVDGLLFSAEDASITQQYNSLNLTVAVATKYGNKLEVAINE